MAKGICSVRFVAGIRTYRKGGTDMEFKKALGVVGPIGFDEYQALAQRTSAKKVTALEKIENGLMGLNGEAGECIDVLKKHKFQGHELNKDKLLDELSDVMWYIAETATGLGVTMQEVAEYNIEKLYKRFPAGFSVERSVNRKE